MSDILLSIPSDNPAAIIVSIMMFLSCLFTYPIYSPPLNEILEETIRNKKTVGIFVSDSKRLIYRLLQTVMISTIAWFCPFFGDIIFFVGGFVFTAISSVIPPILHLICFNHSLSRKSKGLHYVTILFCFVFMCISTFFSAYQLIKKIIE